MSRIAAVLLISACTLFGQDARSIVAESQKRTESKSQQYEGTLRVVDSKGKVTDKRWMYERLGSHGTAKAVLRFTEPAEVRGVLGSNPIGSGEARLT